MSRVRFTADDRYGLWRAGEEAEDLGWEQRDPETGEPLPEDHPDFIPMRVLRLKHGEEIALTNPFERGLIEPVA